MCQGWSRVQATITRQYVTSPVHISPPSPPPPPLRPPLARMPDVLKTREKCVKLCRQSLEKGHSVIIDRQNWSAEQRRFFIAEAAPFANAEWECHALWLNVPKQTCAERIRQRTEHEGGVVGEGGKRVVSFAKAVEPPDSSAEGLARVTVVDAEDTPAYEVALALYMAT